MKRRRKLRHLCRRLKGKSSTEKAASNPSSRDSSSPPLPCVATARIAFGCRAARWVWCGRLSAVERRHGSSVEARVTVQLLSTDIGLFQNNPGTPRKRPQKSGAAPIEGPPTDWPEAGRLLGPTNQVHGVTEITRIVITVKRRSPIGLSRQESHGMLAHQFLNRPASMVCQEPVSFRESIAKRV